MSLSSPFQAEQTSTLHCTPHVSQEREILCLAALRGIETHQHYLRTFLTRRPAGTKGEMDICVSRFVFCSRGDSEGKAGSRVPSPSLWDGRQNSHSHTPHPSFLARTKNCSVVHYKKLLLFFLTRDQVPAACQPIIKGQKRDKTKLLSLILPSKWMNPSPSPPPQMLDREFSQSQILIITISAQTFKGSQSSYHGNESLPTHYSSSHNFMMSPTTMLQDAVSGSASSDEHITCQ